MQARPLHDQVVVKRLEAETQTASGIIITDNAQEKPHQGEVIAVGQVRLWTMVKCALHKLTLETAFSSVSMVALTLRFKAESLSSVAKMKSSQ